MHRDIKLENILIEKGKEGDSEHHCNIKLIDFGSLCKVSNKGLRSNRVGSPLYIAPEVINKSYNEKCDIWSAGVMLYYLLVGSPPFNANSKEELFSKITTGVYPIDTPQCTNISLEAKDLLAQMLALDINERLSASDCLKHPWLNNESISKNQDHYLEVLTRILNYKECDQFKQISFAYIIYCINSNNLLQDVKNAFIAFDNDLDGLLSFDDIIIAYERHSNEKFEASKANRLIEIMSSVDSNNDNKITYEEFLFIAVDREQLMTRENLRIAFEYFDEDNDGFISIEDLNRLFVNNKKQIHHWLLIDNCKVKQISFDEFIERMK